MVELYVFGIDFFMMQRLLFQIDFYVMQQGVTVKKRHCYTLGMKAGEYFRVIYAIDADVNKINTHCSQEEIMEKHTFYVN